MTEGEEKRAAEEPLEPAQARRDVARPAPDDAPDETLEQQVQHRTQALEEARHELREARDLFATLFHSNPIPTALVRVDDGLLLDVNDAYARYFGYERAQIVGRTTYELNMWLPTSERARFITRLREAGSLHSTEVELVLPSGERKTALASAQIVDFDGIEADIAAFVDITERKQLEAEVAEARNRVIRTAEVERLRLAQELHDGPIQLLHALSLRLAGLATAVADDVGEAQLAGANALLQQAIQELREIMKGLRPAVLKEFGLQGAIQSHVERLEQTHPGLDIELHVDADGHLPQPTSLALFRICEQLLHNVVQHAEADHVDVRLDLDGEQVMLEVHDDGKGFDVPDHLRELARHGHLGLVGAAERAESIGGYLNIQSLPNDGTIVRVYVPRHP